MKGIQHRSRLSKTRKDQKHVSDLVGTIMWMDVCICACFLKRTLSQHNSQDDERCKCTRQAYDYMQDQQRQG